MNNPLVPISLAFFLTLATLVLVPTWLRHRRRQATLRLIAELARGGQPLDPAVIEQLLAQPQAPIGKWYALLNLVLGIADLSIGVALLIGAQWLSEGMGANAAQRSSLMIGALMNISIGTGLAVLGLISLRLFADARRIVAHWDFAAVLGLICLFLGVASLAIGTGLTLGANLYMVALSGERAAASMLMGALVNICSGVGFTAVSAVLFWTAKRRPVQP